MKKSTIASLAGLVFAPPIFAAETINLDDVVVTASRVSEPLNTTLHDVSVINQDQIDRAGQSTLIEILQTQAGIEITSNGGAGTASGIYMRGTNSGHVVVLIDGMRISSATAGTTTFENLPTSLINRVEIVRGPATSLYGQDAIGGVIQIFTKKNSGKPMFYAGVGYGTYHTKTAEAGLNGAIDDTHFALGVSAKNTDSFSALDTNNINFSDDDAYKNFSFNASIIQTLAEGHEMGIQFFNSNGHGHFDNSFNIESFSSKFDLEQQSLAFTSKNKLLTSWISKIKVGFSKDKLKSFDEIEPFNNPFNPTKFDTELTQINWQNDFSLPLGTLTLMYDRLEEDIKSTTAYDKTNRINDGYVASYLANIGPHTIQLSYRNDVNSQFGTNNTGGVGYGYHFNDDWHTSVSYGSAYKAPTFNDLYFPGFNNPNLKPEKSNNVEASLRYEKTGTQLSATIYENRIKGLIAFDIATFTIDNLNKANIRGITLAGTQRLGNWQLQGNADIQSTLDEATGHFLARRANRHGTVSLSYDLEDWQFSAEVIASSKRFNNLANTVNLAGYGLLNLTAQYKVNNDWIIQARANNILDKNYSLAVDGNGINYNSPDANLFVNLRYQPQ